MALWARGLCTDSGVASAGNIVVLCRLRDVSENARSPADGVSQLMSGLPGTA